ncbi:MAG: dihydrofolate reductase [Cyclobacteriaceae bacterium]|nr:dihydrofolate reductase [Cyclobacteriaceae bacterium]
MIISIIAAVAENRVIGKDNDLAWSLPDDMKFFVEKTSAHHVIMGRKNWESIPPRFRPLPNRPNIILSRNTGYDPGIPNIPILDSLDKALQLARESGEKEAFIIGGAQIYRLAMPLTNKMYITEVHGSPEGDAFFPSYDKSLWKETGRVHHPADDRHVFSFDFVTYER